MDIASILYLPSYTVYFNCIDIIVLKVLIVLLFHNNTRVKTNKCKLKQTLTFHPCRRQRTSAATAPAVRPRSAAQPKSPSSAFWASAPHYYSTPGASDWSPRSNETETRFETYPDVIADSKSHRPWAAAASPARVSSPPSSGAARASPAPSPSSPGTWWPRRRLIRARGSLPRRQREAVTRSRECRSRCAFTRPRVRSGPGGDLGETWRRRGGDGAAFGNGARRREVYTYREGSRLRRVVSLTRGGSDCDFGDYRWAIICNSPRLAGFEWFVIILFYRNSGLRLRVGGEVALFRAGCWGGRRGNSLKQKKSALYITGNCSAFTLCSFAY